MTKKPDNVEEKTQASSDIQAKRAVYPALNARWLGALMWLAVIFVVLVIFIQKISGYS